jgi:hypothetical protein
MRNVEADPARDEAIALIEEALALCDEHGMGRAAAPYLDLALNLLLAERRIPALVPLQG